MTVGTLHWLVRLQLQSVRSKTTPKADGVQISMQSSSDMIMLERGTECEKSFERPLPIGKRFLYSYITTPLCLMILTSNVNGDDFSM